MATIFISYRRGDGGWAGRLSEHLEEDFDVFFDTASIDYGDAFPGRIDEALRTCRVFFAVIGPEWTTEKNLKRLSDDRDWVRRELSVAIERAAMNQVRLVPILVGDVVRPSSESLPEPLRVLGSYNELPLSSAKWKTDSAMLTEKLRSWLTGNLAVGAGARTIPAALPYLCDRVEQEDGLRDMIEEVGERQRTFFCVLPGHKWEAHDGVIERLNHRRVLDNLFRARELGVDVRRLEWNRAHAAQGRYETVLTRAIARSAAPDADTLEKLQAFLGSLARPLVLVFQLTEDDSRRYPGIVRGLGDAWSGLFRSGAEPIIPRHAIVLWINFSLDAPREEAGLGIASGVLPMLDGIREGHLREWLGLPEVARVAAGRESRVLRLTEDDGCCFEKGKLHMSRFAERVQEILTAP